jgi:hypothetical protein
MVSLLFARVVFSPGWPEFSGTTPEIFISFVDFKSGE